MLLLLLLLITLADALTLRLAYLSSRWHATSLFCIFAFVLFAFAASFIVASILADDNDDDGTPLLL